MYCKNSTVSRVQGCLGIKQDGAFGPLTSQGLVAKGVDGQSITQASIDKVCGGGSIGQPEQEKDPSTALSDDLSSQPATGGSQPSTGESQPSTVASTVASTQGDQNL